MNVFNKYWAVAWISAKSNLAYVGEVGSRLFFLAVILYIFMRLWQVTYANVHSTILGGLSLDDMIWYLAMTETIFMSAPRISSLVDEDVRTGTLAVQLVRPMSYPLYRLAHCLGERYVRFLVTVVAASAIALLLVGPCKHGYLGALLFALAVPGAFALDFIGYFLVGLGAFWLEDTSGLMLIYSRMTMILGGMLIPLELFPEKLQQIVRWLPFPQMVYGPAKILVHPELGALVALLANQIVWLAILSVLVWLVYRQALRRIELNGG